MSRESFIRKATPDDAQYMLDIYAPYVQSTAITFEYEVPSLSEFTDRIVSKTKRFPWLVCEIDGVIAGYAYASNFRERAAYKWDAELSVYVSKEYHGKKIATALYNCLIDILKKQGIRNVYGGVTSPNVASQRLHESFGFEKAGVFRKTGNKFGVWADVTFYAKTINDYDEDPEEPVPINEIDGDILEDIFIHYSKMITRPDSEDMSLREDSSDI
jgi:phosphinothricin acetyltransferase